MRQVGGTTKQLVVRFQGSEESMQGAAGKAGRKPFIRGKLGENTMKLNFKSMAKIGLGIRQARMANELLGAYTENRLRQRRINAAMQFGTYAIGVAKFGVFGLAYSVGDIGYRAAMLAIDQQKRNREAEMLREKSGINARSNSKYSGTKL